MNRGLMIYMQLTKTRVHQCYNINRKKTVAYTLIDIRVYLAHCFVEAEPVLPAFFICQHSSTQIEKRQVSH